LNPTNRDTVYTGRRFADGVEVKRDRRPLSPAASWRVRNHSPTGFEWGYGGSGPAQLALALMLDVLGDAGLAQRCYHWIMWATVSTWSNSWRVTAGELLDLVERWRAEVEGHDHAEPIAPFVVAEGGGA